jgi:hypothetical protein
MDRPGLAGLWFIRCMILGPGLPGGRFTGNLFAALRALASRQRRGRYENGVDNNRSTNE